MLGERRNYRVDSVMSRARVYREKTIIASCGLYSVQVSHPVTLTNCQLFQITFERTSHNVELRVDGKRKNGENLANIDHFDAKFELTILLFNFPN